MKLVTFTGPDVETERVGLLANGEQSVVDLHAAAVEALVGQGAEPSRADAVSRATFSDMTTFIATGEWGKARAREYAERALSLASSAARDLDLVRLRAPLRPTRLRDCIAFEKHLQNFDRDLMEKDTARPSTRSRPTTRAIRPRSSAPTTRSAGRTTASTGTTSSSSAW
jgi:hypothetical protein